MSIRKDVYKITIQKNAYLSIFHKNLDIGCGPAVSLYIHNIEFLKFDCFGHKAGHYHIFNNSNETIYFNETTVEDQINRVALELNDISKYLLLNNNSKIKNFKFNMNILAQKIEIMKKMMLDYEKKYYLSIRLIKSLEF
jgi:hypothetical protein